MFYRSRQDGFSLVEAVIGIALILLALVGLFVAYSFYLKVGLRAATSLQAAFLAEEGMEAARLLRDGAWSNLSSLATATPYYLSWGGGVWSATTTAVLVDNNFTRTIVFDDVYRRNGDKDIVATTSPDAKTFDPDIKKVTVSVSAPGVLARLATYLANIYTP